MIKMCLRNMGFQRIVASVIKAVVVLMATR
jgi:hypothetical protein